MPSFNPEPTATDFPELTGLLVLLCDGEMGQAQWDRLEALLLDDPASQEFYRRFVGLDVDLAWRAAGRTARLPFEVRDSGPATAGAAVELPHQPGEPPVPQPESVIPPIVIDTDSSPFSRLPSSLGSWLISYGAATVLTGMAILGAWMYRVSLDYELAKSPHASGPPFQKSVEPEMEFVGRISGLADCRWVDPQDARFALAPVSLGRKYALSSGLMEISYQSGATVILQGPCTYEIESPSGGFLSLGKLTARVEPAVGSRQSAVGGNETKPESLPTAHCPLPTLFCVRTPTATVTDLGTEFGVEVDQSGATRSYVFRGKVELRPAGADTGDGGGAAVISLAANESATVTVRRDRALTMTREPGNPSKFARRMPERVAITLFNTGAGLTDGDEDPHWQLVARSDDPKFKPRPAVVTSVIAPNWLENGYQSNWISTANGLPNLPNGVSYTFRTTFELADILPGTAVVRGQFIADNHVGAIRLNGEAVSVPEHGVDAPFEVFRSFTIGKGFVEGTNVLEIEVENGAPAPSDLAGPGPMALRVELTGFAFSGKVPQPASGAKKGGCCHEVDHASPSCVGFKKRAELECRRGSEMPGLIHPECFWGLVTLQDTFIPYGEGEMLMFRNFVSLVAAALVVSSLALTAQAEVILSDTLASPSGGQVSGRTPDTVNLPGGTYATIGTIWGQPTIKTPGAGVYGAGLSTGCGEAISLASYVGNGYTKPTQFTISASLYLGEIVTDAQGDDPTAGVGLGFLASNAPSNNSSNFYNAWSSGDTHVGIWLDPNGTLSLIDASPAVKTSVSRLSYVGTWSKTVWHTLKYDVNTTNGTISNVLLDGTLYTFASTYNHVFTDSNTKYACLADGSYTASTYGYERNLVVQTIPEPGTLALLAAGFLGLLCYAWRKRR